MSGNISNPPSGGENILVSCSAGSTPGQSGHGVQSSPPQVLGLPARSSSTNQISISAPTENHWEFMKKMCDKAKKQEEENVALQNRIQSLTEQNKHYEAQLALERAEAQKARNQIQVLQEKLTDQSNKFDLRGKLLESKDSELSQLNGKYIGKLEDLEKVKTIENGLRAENSKLQEKLQGADQVNAKTITDNENLRQSLKSVTAELERKKSEYDEKCKIVQCEIDKIITGRNYLDSRCKALGEELDRKRAQVNALATENATLQQNVSDLSAKLDQKTELLKTIDEEEDDYWEKSIVGQLLSLQEPQKVSSSMEWPGQVVIEGVDIFTPTTANCCRERKCKRMKTSN